MKISPRFTAEDWKAIDFAKEAAWPRAIEIFKDRIDGRFLTPIRMILCYPWSGFAVLALDSLLVETLQQFWEGAIRTPSEKKKGCECEQCECRRLRSQDYFVAFLSSGALFPSGFTKASAELFYKKVRSGILHQAQVTGTSRVRRAENVPLVRTNIEPQGQGKARGITVNPIKFHRGIEKAFEQYTTLLLDATQGERRARFRAKMDAIATEKDDDVQG